MTRRLLWCAGIAVLWSGLAAPAATCVATRYRGQAAYRLSDGRSEAVVVPAWGRVLAYGPVGGPNLLWNGPDTAPVGAWPNRGGDKVWPAPQSAWPLFMRSGWPPDPSWDSAPYMADMLGSAKLRTISGIWAGWCVMVTRTFEFAANGSLTITQTATKIGGEPRQLSLWSVTQIPHTDRVYVPLNPNSVFKGGFRWIGAPPTGTVTAMPAPELLEVQPFGDKPWKLGADCAVSAIAAVLGDVLFTERAAHPGGEYPDWGCPVEFYHNGAPDADYNELELLSPLCTFKVGQSWTHTVHWSWQRLPTDPAERLKAAADALQAKPGV